MDTTIVCTLKLTAEEKKWLKYQIQSNQTTVDKMKAANEFNDKDRMITEEMQKVNNSILKKLF